MSRSESRSLCGGCAKPAEVVTLHMSPAMAAGACGRCGFPTYLQLDAPVPACTAATHDALRADVGVFEDSTKNAQQWAGLLTAECLDCGSTLALYLCKLCTEPCASGDMLPWGPEEEDGRAHFECVANGVLASGHAKFVVVVGKGTAREFAREAVRS